MEPIGKVKIENDKIIDMDEKFKHTMIEMKEKSEKDTVKPKPKPKKDNVEYKSDEFTEELLSDHVGGKGGLKSIVQKIASREKGSYNFGDLKNMKKVI